MTKLLIKQATLYSVVFRAVCNASEYISERRPDPYRRLMVEIIVRAIIDSVSAMDSLLSTHSVKNAARHRLFAAEANQFIGSEMCDFYCELIGLNPSCINKIISDIKNKVSITTKKAA